MKKRYNSYSRYLLACIYYIGPRSEIPHEILKSRNPEILKSCVKYRDFEIAFFGALGHSSLCCHAHTLLGVEVTGSSRHAHDNVEDAFGGWMMAASNSCFVVSNAVHYVHGSLPFLTALSGAGEATTANLSLAMALIGSPDYLGSLFDLYVVSCLGHV